jgi:hypothetical protein
MEKFEEEIKLLDDKNKKKKIIKKWQKRVKKLIWNMIKSWLIVKEWELLICKI